MQSFGETLKAEREDRGLTIEAVAQLLSVDQERLRALERNDFAALPDEATMLSCLNAFADCLGVDTELMIEDYVKERDHWLQQLDEDISKRSAPVSRPPWVIFALIVAAAAVIVIAWWVFSAGKPSPNLPAPSNGVASEATESPSVDPPLSQPAEAAEPPAPIESTSSSSLTIPDSGVGTGIRSRQLVGRSDHFIEGTPVWFWTQVDDGSRGDRIDHVWIHEGVEETRVSLNIGAARWRTYSTRLLGPGSVGRWAVEARDDTGQVLVRHEFVVGPASAS